MKRKGFTLAEVLITLVIIGVISALTIPGVIVSYQKKQTVVKLKKEYLTFAEAINYAIKDFGQISTWKLETIDQIVEDYFKPYLKIKDKKYPDRYQYKYLNGNSGYFSQGKVYFLEDGTAFYLTFEASHHWWGIRIYIDINGIKGPNVWGKDIFAFTMKSYCYGVGKSYLNKFIPEGIDCSRNGKTREQLLGDESNSCTKNQNTAGAGWSCAALIMLDGWEIKDDYPW